MHPWGEQIGHLKAMTIRTGAIHEAQVLQVRTLPAVLPEVKKIDYVEIDPISHRIYYDCLTNVPWAMDDQMRTQLKYMRWVLRNILWDDVDFLLKQSGEVFYDSRNE